ncbi:MAG: hypothetical protein WDN04_08170 [Rhodospirillales bacterium]
MTTIRAALFNVYFFGLTFILALPTPLLRLVATHKGAGLCAVLGARCAVGAAGDLRHPR